VYVEERAFAYEKTQTILTRLNRSNVIKIGHYKDLFNRPNQDYRAQKESMNLILAVKEEPFFYKGSFYSDAFEYKNYFYTPTMLNCLYDCDYCYLQGMYSSANIVLFVNSSDFIHSIETYLDEPTLIAISYDTDLLAFERFSGEVREWLGYASTRQNLHLEVRTKSANFSAIADIVPNPNVVLAWTLSPQDIIEKYEPKTPSAQKRIDAIVQAIEAGWNVRVCIDPMIISDQEVNNYRALVHTLFEQIDAQKLYQLTLGTFRMSSQHLKQLKKYAHTPLAFYPYSVKEGTVSYPKSLNDAMISKVLNVVTEYIPKTKVRIWDAL
jgi:spore photoproduct lyase